MEHFSTSLVSFIWPALFTFLYFISCDKETSCTRLLAHDHQLLSFEQVKSKPSTLIGD